MRPCVGALLLFGWLTGSCQPKAGDPGPPAPPLAPAEPPATAPASPIAVSEPLLEDRRIDWTTGPVMRVLGHIAERMTDGSYAHGTQVDERRGIYRFDCSGMVEWVLCQAAPTANRAREWGVGGRPLARDYQRRIAAIPPGSERRGWRRISRVEDAAPGDLIAWRKPDIVRSANSGHVAFIVLPPQRVPGHDGTFLVRVADSSSLLHDDDTRVGRTGFGLGTILLVTDPVSGAPVAYGWSGLKWRTFETEIAIGRPLG